jgi:hypothetical protein
MTLIPIRGNALGLAMVVVTGLVAGLGSFVFRLGDALVMGSVGVALIAMDLLIRLRARPAAGWLTRSENGGYFFFVPVWVVGIVMIIVNIINVFIGPG